MPLEIYLKDFLESVGLDINTMTKEQRVKLKTLLNEFYLEGQAKINIPMFLFK